MGAVTKFTDAEVYEFLSRIGDVYVYKWYIVLAPSSGVGWQYNPKTADENYA